MIIESINGSPLADKWRGQQLSAGDRGDKSDEILYFPLRKVKSVIKSDGILSRIHQLFSFFHFMA